MKYAYSYTEIAAAEERAAGEGLTVTKLMEQAGGALAYRVEKVLRGFNVGDCVFVVGGGNNGGDGWVAAEMLRQRGFDVTVICLAEKFTEAAMQVRANFHGEALSAIPRRSFRVGVDCLFGTGLTRPIGGIYTAAVDFLSTCEYVVACDVPSGLSEGGVALGPAVKANETVTMGAFKQALLLADGIDLSGSVYVADLGLKPTGGAMVYEDADIAAFFPPKRSHSNKGTYGTSLILAGGSRFGAPLLSAGASLKSGAGYTKLCLPAEAISPQTLVAVSARMPACIVQGYDGESIASAQAVAYGMGAGVGEAQYEMLKALLAEYCGVLILDADALNMLAVYGKEPLRYKKCKTIVTPHPKEFAGLTGRAVGEVLQAPIAYAQSFALEYGVTVVLKNNRTVITDGTQTAINPTGSPALAKGGSGDVLSGLMCGIAARGVLPFEAAVSACFILGRAGEQVEKAMGEYASDASDIISALPNAIKALEAAK